MLNAGIEANVHTVLSVLGVSSLVVGVCAHAPVAIVKSATSIISNFFVCIIILCYYSFQLVLSYLVNSHLFGDCTNREAVRPIVVAKAPDVRTEVETVTAGAAGRGGPTVTAGIITVDIFEPATVVFAMARGGEIEIGASRIG